MQGPRQIEWRVAFEAATWPVTPVAVTRVFHDKPVLDAQQSLVLHLARVWGLYHLTVTRAAASLPLLVLFYTERLSLHAVEHSTIQECKSPDLGLDAATRSYFLTT